MTVKERRTERAPRWCPKRCRPARATWLLSSLLALGLFSCKKSPSVDVPPTSTATATHTAPEPLPDPIPTSTGTAPGPDAGGGGGGVACNAKESRTIARRDPKDNPRTRQGSPRIVGGQLSSLTWPVAITVDGTDRTQFCGGSLIAPEWVLTAAHCQVQTGDKLIVGRSDLTTSSGKVLEATMVRNHAAYDADTMDNDLAVIRLSEASTVTPVALYTGTSDLAGSAGTVAGWGHLREGGPASPKLMQVDVPVITNTVCNAGYAGDNVQITGNMLCAGLAQGGKDSCQGDSGGPLAVRAGNTWEQAGIVSFGIGCARPNKYGVYTRVANYTAWISACTK